MKKAVSAKSIFSQNQMGQLKLQNSNRIIFLAVRLYLIRPEYRLYTQAKSIRKEQIDYIEYLETKGAEITGISNGTIAVSEQNNE